VKFFSFYILFYLNTFYNILYFALTEKEECERSSLINESTDNECEISNAVDGDATDFIDNNVDIRIDPEMPDKIMSHGTSLLNNKASLSQQRMYKVIPIKMNKKVTEV